MVYSASCKIISWNVFSNLLSLLRDKELKIEQVTCFTVSVTEDILELGTLMNNNCHKAFTWTLFTIRDRNIDIWNESKTFSGISTFIISLHRPIFFKSDFVILVCVIYQARNVLFNTICSDVDTKHLCGDRNQSRITCCGERRILPAQVMRALGECEQMESVIDW